MGKCCWNSGYMSQSWKVSFITSVQRWHHLSHFINGNQFVWVGTKFWQIDFKNICMPKWIQPTQYLFIEVLIQTLDLWERECSVLRKSVYAMHTLIWEMLIIIIFVFEIVCPLEDFRQSTPCCIVVGLGESLYCSFCKYICILINC